MGGLSEKDAEGFTKGDRQMKDWRKMEIRYEAIITGRATRMVDVFASSFKDARMQVEESLKPGESIYSLDINRR